MFVREKNHSKLYLPPAVDHTLNHYTQYVKSIKFCTDVKGTRPPYEYRAPFVYVKPVAELETVDTPQKKNHACNQERHYDGAV